MTGSSQISSKRPFPGGAPKIRCDVADNGSTWDLNIFLVRDIKDDYDVVRYVVTIHRVDRDEL